MQIARLRAVENTTIPTEDVYWTVNGDLVSEFGKNGLSSTVGSAG